MFKKDTQYYRFCAYGFLKNLRFFEPFLILILHAEGLSFTQIASLYAIREIARNIMEIPAGVFADTFGRRRSMILAFTSYLFSFATFFLGGSYLMFIPAFLLYAVGDAFRTGTHKAMIFTHLQINSWEDFKVSYYGQTRSWSQIGSAISALGAGIIVLLTREYKLIFLITILPYLLDLVNLASYPKNLEGSHVNQNRIRIFPALKSTISDFVIAFSNRGLRKTVLGLSIYTGYYKAVKDFIQPIIQLFALSLPLWASRTDEQRTAVMVGLVYFILYMSSSFVARRSGLFVKKFPDARSALSMTVIIGVITGLISGLLILFGLNFLALIFFAGIYLVENLRKPVGIGKIADQLDPRILASALSAESQAETLFAAIFVLILGLLIDCFGLGWGIFCLSLIILLIKLLSSNTWTDT